MIFKIATTIGYLVVKPHYEGLGEGGGVEGEEGVDFSENQFRFILERSTIEVINLVRRLV